MKYSLDCLFHFKFWNYYPTNFCLFLTSCFSLVGKRRQTVREKMRSCQGRVLHARTKTPNVFLISKAFPFWYGPIFVEKHKLQMHHKSGVFLQRHKKPKQCVQILLHTSTTSTLTPSEVGAK